MTRFSRFSTAALLLAAACSAAPQPGPTPPATGTASSPATGAATLRPSATPGATSSAPLRSPGPAGTSSPLAEPDFRGTGCYPDIPTPFTVTVSPERKIYARGEHVTLLLDVVPTGPSRVEHANAQEFDFALELRGEEVWRWSSVAPLIPPTHYEHTYRSGATRRFTATWNQKYARSGRDALSGEYTLRGYFIGNMKEPPPPGRFICFDEDGLTIA